MAVFKKDFETVIIEGEHEPAIGKSIEEKVAEAVAEWENNGYALERREDLVEEVGTGLPDILQGRGANQYKVKAVLKLVKRDR